MSEIEKLEDALSDLHNARTSDSLTDYPKNETLDTAVQALREKLEREQEPNGWIKCSEKLPKYGTSVIGLIKIGNDLEVNRVEFSEYGYFGLDGMVFVTDWDAQVTHWMSMPIPPKEEL